MSQEIKHIGWIGTGIMGKAMCKHLLNANFTLTVFNRTKSKTDELVALGANYATPHEMAPRIDALIIMVGHPKDLQEQFFEKDLLSALKPNTVIVDHTSSSPDLAKEIQKKAKTLNLQSLDCPVSGGDVGAANGKLVLMCGGEKEVFERVQPIFKCYSQIQNLMGDAGAGQHTKMVNQITIAGSMIGVAESLVYGYKAGIDLPTQFETISCGAAGSFSMTTFAPRILRRDMNPGGFLEYLVKDIEISLDECRRMNLSLPGLALVDQLYRGIMANGGAKLGAHALILAIENMNGLETPKYDYQ